MSNKNLEDLQRGALYGAEGSTRRKLLELVGMAPKKEVQVPRGPSTQEMMKESPVEQVMLPSVSLPAPIVKPIPVVTPEPESATETVNEQINKPTIVEMAVKKPERITFPAIEPGTDPDALVDMDSSGLPSDMEIRKRVLEKMRRGF